MPQHRRRHRPSFSKWLTVFQALSCILIAQVYQKHGIRQVNGQSSCPLSCRNGGDCRPGAITIGNDSPTNGKNPSKSGSYYCHCPRGYWGPLCEIKYAMCASQNDTCFSQQPCFRDVDFDGNSFYHCECDVKESDLSTPRAVQYCQHAATTFCVTTKKTPDISLGPQGGSYCASGGRCKPPRNGTHHAGCFCPDKWTGSYCEIPVGYEEVAALVADGGAGLSAPTVTSQTSSRAMSILKGILSGLVLFVTGIGIIVLVYHGRGGTFHTWITGGYFRPVVRRTRSEPSPRQHRDRVARRRRSRRQPGFPEAHDGVELTLPREPFRDRVEPAETSTSNREIA